MARYLPKNVVVEAVIAGQSDQTTTSNSHGEKNLVGCVFPNLQNKSFAIKKEEMIKAYLTKCGATNDTISRRNPPPPPISAAAASPPPPH
jgi:hypothetical protein